MLKWFFDISTGFRFWKIEVYLISSYSSELENGVVRKFTETFISSLSVEPFAV